MTQLLADRYELGATLGAGGMARVVEAEDRLLARRVAVKLLHDSAMVEPRARDRFLAEARAAASLSHPNAVAVYDIGRDNDLSFIVMELVQGTTLAEALHRRGALEESEAVAVAAQILGALASAHARGLVHRDVKPANVLLPGGLLPDDPEGPLRVKLADFGIAKGIREAAGALTATGQLVGTPKYLSPEVVVGEPATPRSDVYATGVVLFQMLAGRPPFDGDSALAVALAHRHDAPPRLDRLRRGVDPALVALVERALEKDPADRFADAADMRVALLDRRRRPAPRPAPARTTARPRPAAATSTDVRGTSGRRPTGQATTTPRRSGRSSPPPRRRRGFLVPLILGMLALLAIMGVVAVRELPLNLLPL